MRFGVIDFFSGCGGASTGFSASDVPGSSVEIIAGIDINPSACATYERMHVKPCLCKDITQLFSDKNEFEELIASWELHRFDHLILIGCAPCQGFSAHRKSKHGDDPRRPLFVLFSEIAQKLNPSAIFMENVPDLFSKKHWAYYMTGRDNLISAGYIVKSQIYNFAGFGLPQERFRAVMLAMNMPFQMPEPPLSPDEFITVRDAIGALPPLIPGEASKDDPMHITSRHRHETIEILRKIPKDGGNRPVGVGPSCLDKIREKHGGFTDVYGRLAWKRPSVTITARCRTPSCGRFTHPEQDRGLSVREAALLQGFPPDFTFEGGFDDKFMQIGNAVPPLVARHFANHIIRTLMGLKPELSTSDSNLVTAPVGPGFAVTINGIKKKRIKNIADDVRDDRV